MPGEYEDGVAQEKSFKRAGCRRSAPVRSGEDPDGHALKLAHAHAPSISSLVLCLTLSLIFDSLKFTIKVIKGEIQIHPVGGC
jgi:hypothetical protein